MKKKILSAVLCVILLAALLPVTSAGADGLRFISINDTLPPELINAAVDYGGVIYVPYWLFTNYGLGLDYVYFSSVSTAFLHNDYNQLFFEMSTGRTYDGDDYYYSVSAIWQGGTIFLPLRFVCAFFGGMNCSTITGSEYGTVLRVTTSAVELDDGEFIRAARTLMNTYYQKYSKPEKNNKPEEPVVETPSPIPVVTEPPHAGDTVYLGMSGFPGGEALELLRRYGMGCCIFLSPEELRSDPDGVRRLACLGFGIGIRCDADPASEAAEALELLREIARVRAMLVLLPEDAAVPDGLVGYRPSEESGYLLLDCTETVPARLSGELRRLNAEGYTVAAPRETLKSIS